MLSYIIFYLKNVGLLIVLEAVANKSIKALTNEDITANLTATSMRKFTRDAFKPTTSLYKITKTIFNKKSHINKGNESHHRISNCFACISPTSNIDKRTKITIVHTSQTKYGNNENVFIQVHDLLHQSTSANKNISKLYSTSVSRKTRIQEYYGIASSIGTETTDETPATNASFRGSTLLKKYVYHSSAIQIASTSVKTEFSRDANGFESYSVKAYLHSPTSIPDISDIFSRNILHPSKTILKTTNLASASASVSPCSYYIMRNNTNSTNIKEKRSILLQHLSPTSVYLSPSSTLGVLATSRVNFTSVGVSAYLKQFDGYSSNTKGNIANFSEILLNTKQRSDNSSKMTDISIKAFIPELRSSMPTLESSRNEQSIKKITYNTVNVFSENCLK